MPGSCDFHALFYQPKSRPWFGCVKPKTWSDQVQHYSRAVEYNQEEYSVLSPPPSSNIDDPLAFLLSLTKFMIT